MPASDQLLSNTEISQKMREKGFPELAQCWSDFLKLKCPAAELNDLEVQRQRVAHMNPLFGAPAAIAALALPAGIATSSIMAPAINDLARPLPECARPAVHAAYSLNIAVLLMGAVMALQRYVFYPYKRIMARDAASMLRWKNYRAAIETSDRFQAIHKNLENWDNPNYAKVYKLQSGKVEEIIEETLPDKVQRCLRNVLGHKDQKLRRYVPGRFMNSLLEGKRSINQFIANHQAELTAIREGTIDVKAAIVLLRDLHDNYCSKDSAAREFLSSELANLENLPENVARTQVWQRDPWVDLTSQKEFFSSASLRSKNIFEAGSKGRLGTFGYLRNPAICCLDFTTRRGRCVRARMVACAAKNAKGKTVSVLFVDGVEGTNSVKPIIIQTAIEHYTRTCGFNYIAYNAAVHNLTPRLLVTSVAKSYGAAKEFKLQALDHITPEYLDAFGLPLQPFEYCIPQGKVLAHLKHISGDETPLEGAESLAGKFHRFMQRKLLYLLFADSVAIATLAAAQVSLTTATALFCLCSLGLIVNEWYKKRSKRTEKL